MHRTIVLFALLIVFLIFLLSALGAGMMDFMPDDDTFEEDGLEFMGGILYPWTGTLGYRLLVFLEPGLSIFTLFIVYLGGRAKNRRFNDRIIDDNFVFEGTMLCLKTALYRAVFNFRNPLPGRGRYSFAIDIVPSSVLTIGGIKP